MKNSNSGIALVAVILVSAIALITMLFASATLSLGARSAAASERDSTQALLAADSGLNTLRARGSLTPYGGGSFGDWISENFSSVNLGGGVTASLSVIDETADFVTVQSVGAVGTSRRTLIQEFAIRRGPPVPISVSVPGALTSVATIKSQNAALCVTGKSNREEDWTVTRVVSEWPNGNVGDCGQVMSGGTKVRLRDATICDALVGQYLRVDGMLMRLDSVPADWPSDCSADVTLVPVGGGAPVTRPGSTNAAIRPTAISEPLVVSGGTPRTSVVTVTPGTPSLFGVGRPITIGNTSGGQPSSGKVVAVDGLTLTIEWDEGRAPSGSQPEGTIVRREISSGVTQNNCSGAGSSTFPNGCVGGVDLSQLFKDTFGVSRDDLYASLTPDQIITASQATDGRVLSGLTWVTNPSNGGMSGQKGSGILIIDARDLKELKLNTDNQFDGLIYIIGNAKINGNSQFKGAVIVEGGAEISDTFAQGNGGIFYDPLQLLRSLDGITVPNPNPGGLGLPVANSWRIR